MSFLQSPTTNPTDSPTKNPTQSPTSSPTECNVCTDGKFYFGFDSDESLSGYCIRTPCNETNPFADGTTLPSDIYNAGPYDDITDCGQNNGRNGFWYLSVDECCDCEERKWIAPNPDRICLRADCDYDGPLPAFGNLTACCAQDGGSPGDSVYDECMGSGAALDACADCTIGDPCTCDGQSFGEDKFCVSSTCNAADPCYGNPANPTCWNPDGNVTTEGGACRA